MIDSSFRAKVTLPLTSTQCSQAPSVLNSWWQVCDFVLFANMAHQSPAYLSPERLTGLGASNQSDVYAFGVLLWEVFARQKPFAAEVAKMLAASRSLPQVRAPGEPHVLSPVPITSRPG